MPTLAISDDTARTRWSVYGLVSAPAQNHATDDAVYTALFEFNDVIIFILENQEVCQKPIRKFSIYLKTSAISSAYQRHHFNDCQI